MVNNRSSGTRPKTASTSRKPCWPPCSEREREGRVRRLEALSARAGFSAFLLSTPASLGYFAGLYLEHFHALVLPGRLVLYGHALARREADFYRPTRARILREQSLFRSRLIPPGARVGVEGILPAHFLRRLEEAFPGRSFEPSGLPLVARSVKSAGEIRQIRRAGRVLAEARRLFCDRLDPGETECASADRLSGILAGLGAREAFPTIFAAGAAAFFPHALPRRRRPGARDWVVLDCGARYFEYCVDCTRVLFPERLSREGRGRLELLRAAAEAARRRARPGVTARTVDAAARDILEKAGLGRYFIHGLGHGVGLDVHEFPSLNPRSEHLLEEGMVFTIEPGIYLPGWGGLRLEDTFVMRADGVENVTGE